MSAVLNRQVAKTLRDLTAAAIAGEKAYATPANCRRYGLADGAEEEAFQSKFKEVAGLV
jgi:hypothetical protein